MVVPEMIYCDQKKCEHVATSPDGSLTCTLPQVILTRVENGRSFILNCSGYTRRSNWNPASPGRGIPAQAPTICEDGLYPGQIKPPVDYSDYDPEEETIRLVDTTDTCDT